MSRYSITESGVTLSSGKYYIGDPCYVIPDEDWMQALVETNYFNMFASREAVDKCRYNRKQLQKGVFLYHADDMSLPFHLAVCSTAYGDGSYACRDDGVYIGSCGVDAGLIGVIPVEMIKVLGADNTGAMKLGVVHDFRTPFRIAYKEGVVSFANVTVDTTEDYDEG